MAVEGIERLPKGWWIWLVTLVVLLALVLSLQNACSGRSVAPGSAAGEAIQSPPATSQTQVSKTSDIRAGDTNTLDFDAPEIAVSRLSILASNSAEDVEVRVTRLDEVSIPVPADGRAVYQYLAIDHDKLPENDIRSVNVDFRVTRDWLSKLSYSKEDVVLARYTDAWQVLETRIVKEDPQNIEYSAVSPGLSIFAITVTDREQAATGLSSLVPTVSTSPLPHLPRC